MKYKNSKKEKLHYEAVFLHEEKRKESIKQKKYIFCKENDRDALFEEIDKKISVPLIP